MALAEMLAGCPIGGSPFEQLKLLVRVAFDHGGIAAVQALAARAGTVSFYASSRQTVSIPVIDIDEGNVCGRCGAPWMASITNPDLASWTDNQESRGASICSEGCALRPAWCRKCEGAKVPRHSRWCPKAEGEG